MRKVLVLFSVGLLALVAATSAYAQDIGQCGDSVRNGAIMGFATGASLGALFGPLLFHSDTGPQTSSAPVPSAPAPAVPPDAWREWVRPSLIGAGVYGSIGAVIGAAIDLAIHGQTTACKPASEASKVIIRPFVTPTSKGVLGTVRF